MRTFLTTAAALLLLASASRPSLAQEEEGEEGSKKTAPGIPSRYQDCVQPLTLDILMSVKPSQWGFSGDLAKTASDRMYGIQLCRSYVEENRHYCRQLANIPGGKEKSMFDKLGYQCATDAALFQTHTAIRSGGAIPFEPRCIDWCELVQVGAAKKMPCADFCRDVKPLLPQRIGEACKVFVDRTAPFNKEDPDYAREVAIECKMRLDPSPANCAPDQLGPMAQKSCREHHAVLEAARLNDPKLCPKSHRMGPVCAAMTTPVGKPQAAACLAATKAFTVPFCDELKASGGLQDNTKLPSDPDNTKVAW